MVWCLNDKLFGHYPASILDKKNALRFGDYILSPSSGKKGTPTLLGPVDRAGPYLRR
jgi:hypothetical protein